MKLKRQNLFIILIAGLFFLFIIPTLFIVMLPSLIFGNTGLTSVSEKVLNDNSIIIENIANAENCIEAVLRKKHDDLLEKIYIEAASLGDDCEYSITDDFADQIIYESTLIISLFCASQDDYSLINLEHLTKVLSEHTDDIFSYTTTVTTHEVIEPKTQKTYTVYHYEYTVEYAGDSYFAESVFSLDEEHQLLAESYASNLHLFLFDSIYYVEYNSDLIAGETGHNAVTLAMTKQGTPYSQEHRNEDGYFDCSSFTYWVYSQLGINLLYDGANTAAAQGRYIVENNLAIPYSNLAPGDLVFYNFGVNNRYMNIGHVGIYAGNGYIIDASSSKKKVVYRPIYSTNNIVLCGRPYSD